MLLFNPISSSQVLTAAIKKKKKPRNLGEVISKETDRNATSYISEEQEQTKPREVLDNYADPVQSTIPKALSSDSVLFLRLFVKHL